MWKKNNLILRWSSQDYIGWLTNSQWHQKMQTDTVHSTSIIAAQADIHTSDMDKNGFAFLKSFEYFVVLREENGVPILVNLVCDLHQTINISVQMLSNIHSEVALEFSFCNADWPALKLNSINGLYSKMYIFLEKDERNVFLMEQ